MSEPSICKCLPAKKKIQLINKDKVLWAPIPRAWFQGKGRHNACGSLRSVKKDSPPRVGRNEGRGRSCSHMFIILSTNQ